MKAAAVFDLDGTLVHSAPDVLACLELALLEAGIAVDGPIPDSVIGPPVRGMIGRLGLGCSPEQEDAAVAAFRRIYDGSNMPLTRPYPEVEPLLSTLKSRGWCVCLATNKPITPTLRLIDRFFPGLIDEICCIDSMADRRLSKREMLEELSSRRKLLGRASWMIGDTSADIAAGREIGWRTIAVDWGYGSAEEFNRETPTFRAIVPSEILTILENG